MAVPPADAIVAFAGLLLPFVLRRVRSVTPATAVA
jgi:hypothetical protein